MILDSRTIKYLMFSQSRTQDSLAEAAGLSRTTINYICNGKSCRADTAAKIAAALDVPVCRLIKKSK